MEPGSAPLPWQALAGDGARHAHRRFGTAVSLLQGDLEIETQVLAAHVRASTGASTRTAGAKHLLEDIAEHRAEIEALAALEGTARATGAAFEGSRPITVIGSALLRVLQDVVGVIDVFEFLLGFLVTRIAVRVMLHGEFAERLLYVVGTCRPADSSSS